MKCNCKLSRVNMDGHCMDCGGQKDFIIVSAYTVRIILPFGMRLNIELLRSKKTKDQDGQ